MLERSHSKQKKNWIDFDDESADSVQIVARLDSEVGISVKLTNKDEFKKQPKLQFDLDIVSRRKNVKNKWTVTHVPIVKEHVGIADEFDSFDAVIVRLESLSKPLE